MACQAIEGRHQDGGDHGLLAVERDELGQLVFHLLLQLDDLPGEIVDSGRQKLAPDRVAGGLVGDEDSVRA